MQYYNGLITKKDYLRSRMVNVLSENMLQPACGKGRQTTLVIGPSGSGKTWNYVVPNIRQMNGSYVVTCDNIERYKDTIEKLKENGYNVKIFNIADPENSEHYNFFDYLENEENMDLFIRDVSRSLTECQLNTEDLENDSNQYFIKAAILVFCACIHYLKDYGKDRDKNMKGLYDLIMLAGQTDENGERSFDKLFNNISKESTAYKYYKKLKETVEKNTLKSVFISAALNIQPMGSEQIQKIITDDTLDLKSIRREKTTLFIVLPSSDNSFQCLLTTLLIQMIYVLEREKMEMIKEKEEWMPVFFMLDEFANIGRILGIDTMIQNLYGHDSVALIVQDINQIDRLYGKKRAEEIKNSCNTKLLLGNGCSNTMDTMSYIIDSIKPIARQKFKRTPPEYEVTSLISESQNERSVLDALEIRKMITDNQCLIVCKDGTAILDSKYKPTKQREGV